MGGGVDEERFDSSEKKRGVQSSSVKCLNKIQCSFSLSLSLSLSLDPFDVTAMAVKGH